MHRQSNLCHLQSLRASRIPSRVQFVIAPLSHAFVRVALVIRHVARNRCELAVTDIRACITHAAYLLPPLVGVRRSLNKKRKIYSVARKGGFPIASTLKLIFAKGRAVRDGEAITGYGLVKLIAWNPAEGVVFLKDNGTLPLVAVLHGKPEFPR